MLDPDAFRTLFEAHPRPMFVTDRDTQQIIAVNAAACDLYGWTREELVDMTLRDIRPPEELVSFERSYADATKPTTATYSRRGRHRTKHGRIIDVALEIAPMTLGDRVASLAVVTDMTGIDQAERRFRLLVEHSADGISLVDENNVVEYVSPGGQRILGYDPADILGVSAEPRTHPDDVPQWTPPAPGETRHHVARLRHRDGSWRWIESTTTNLTHDPAVRAYVSNYRDITERKLAEQERDAMLARVAMADRMVSVGTLAAGVAHEINNPLAYIVTNLDVLASELPNIHPAERSRLTDATLQAIVADTREGVARVTAIVRDLRALSRGDDDKRGPVDVAAVMTSSLKMANNEIRHRARVVQSYEDQLPCIEADASRLGQVFLNLLLNAAQAIVDGSADTNEVRVTIAPAGGRVRVDVADTGCGIAANTLPRIFDPFFTTKPPGAGIGLGLSISHQIVTSMGGEITVASEHDRGSTFTVWLPVAPATATVDAVEKPSKRAPARRVLLIDDEPAVGRSLELLLAPDTVVVAVTRAEDALSRLAGGERFDAILCDLMMPRTTGIEVYDQVLRIAPGYAAKIVFMTGGAFTQAARDFLAGLQRPHLRKPFTEAQLRNAIADVAR
jgi:PAS domain S-box-containing protein